MATSDEMTVRVPVRRQSLRRQLQEHVHEWRLVAEETDLSGTVREFLCLRCDEVHFA